MELWKDVKGYEGLYEVSNLGNVRAKDRIVRGKNNTTRRISGNPVYKAIFKGYATVKLYKNNIGRHHKVHRLVLTAFADVENSDSLDVNHINGKKTDNRLANLEWCTRKENLLHAVEIGLNVQCMPIRAVKEDTTIYSKSIAGMYRKISALENIKCKEKTFKENVRRALITRGTYYGYTFYKGVKI